jgi:peptidoglycan/LPS O-acetylase OafA/YrhL
MGPGLFRLLLATVVVVFHYSSFSLGHAAVYLFFVLSGYWVYQMWERKYSRTRHPYLTFAISRAWRIAPVFLLCSLLACALVWVQVRLATTPPAEPAGMFWAVLPSAILLGYNSTWFAPLIPAWSLDIEMQYYLVAPLLLLALKRRPATAFVLVAAAGLAFTALHGHATLAAYLPCFMAGMLAARFPGRVNDRRLVSASLIATTLLIAIPLVVPAWRSVLLGGVDPGPLYRYNELFNVLVTLACLPFALGTVTQRSSKADQLMADLSFSVYLFHWIPHQIVNQYFPALAKEPRLDRALALCAIFAVTYALAVLITLAVDRPANRARGRFVHARLAADRGTRTEPVLTPLTPVIDLTHDALAASLGTPEGKPT